MCDRNGVMENRAHGIPYLGLGLGLAIRSTVSPNPNLGPES